MNKLSQDHIRKYMTPYKLGAPVIAGSGRKERFDSQAVDCPFVFRHQDRYFMLYVGFDGAGYQTALAVSDNLTDWRPYAEILNRSVDRDWDRVGAAGTWILKNDHLYEPPTLKKVDGKYWMVYHAYPHYGYEEGPAEIGLAWSDDEQLISWNRLEQPVFTWKDGDDWEKGGLYKACIVEHEGRFYMFYNAKNTDPWVWTEQIGLAVSDDLIRWSRVEGNPQVRVRANSWMQHFAADPYVVRDDDRWLMFFYGYDGMHAQEGIAVSYDLVNWQVYEEPIIRIGNAGEIDEIHAHKPSVIYADGTLYHYYCAVRSYRPGDPAQNADMTGLHDYEFRCITVAASQRLNR